MEFREEYHRPLSIRYASDTNELPEIEERLLAVEQQLEILKRQLLQNSEPLDPYFNQTITDHFWELS